jgi:hypothetical protein
LFRAAATFYGSMNPRVLYQVQRNVENGG